MKQAEYPVNNFKKVKKVSQMFLPHGLKKKDLQFIGKGVHGQVYRINHSSCIKIFNEPEVKTLEMTILQKAANEPRFPKVYESGPNYLIREYIEGIPLSAYLRKYPLTEAISSQLIEIFKVFEKLHFTCLDIGLNNLIITPDGLVRVIDPVGLKRVVRVYPKKMLSHLKKIGIQETFLKHVKKMKPELYQKWMEHSEDQDQ
jgi:putative serine/threonine protein kinase